MHVFSIHALTTSSHKLQLQTRAPSRPSGGTRFNIEQLYYFVSLTHGWGILEKMSGFSLDCSPELSPACILNFSAMARDSLRRMPQTPLCRLHGFNICTKSYRARCADATIGSVCSLCGLWFWVGCRWLNKPGINMFMHINTHTTVLPFFLALGLKIQFHHLEPMGLSWTVTHLLESQCRWPILISRDTHSVWVIDWWDLMVDLVDGRTNVRTDWTE